MKYGELIEFTDLLDKAVDVDGLYLEATINTVVRRISTGACFIEYWDVGDIYLNHNGDLIKLDQGSFRQRNKTIYDRFINVCELKALNRAKNALEHEFQEIEEGA